VAAPAAGHRVVLTRRPIRRRLPVTAAGLARLPPVLARVYAARGVTDASELDYALARMVPVRTLDGVEAATDLLACHLEAGRRIVVVGDFDADGATSTVLLVRVLRGLGADVGYLVPDRVRHGYGLSPLLVREAAAGRPALIVTVDSGINCHAGVALARQYGIAVLVTDHHLPGETLPDADVILNPNLVGQRFPSRCLAGVGVAFYLAASLARRHTGTGRPAAALLDLVALGTVADLVPLDANNRILVERGLARIRAGDCRPGVTALLAAGGRDPVATTSADLAFAAGPRLNAAGRLEDMSIGIECLLTDDRVRACELAGVLSRINDERKSIEARMQEEALTAVAGLEPDLDALPPALCLHRPGWHPGVVGLVAARLRERYHRPAVAFATDAEGRLKGSARSIPGLHMRDVLAAVDVRHPGLIGRYGGHAMAAGLSLAADALAAFDAALRDEVAARVDAADLAGEIWSDGELADGELDLPTAELLMNAGPWGQGFPEPLFDGRFHLLGSDVVGGRHLRLRLRPAGGSSIVQGIAFRQADSFVGPRTGLVHVAYRLGVNDYGGMRRAQLVVDYLEPA